MEQNKILFPSTKTNILPGPAFNSLSIPQIYEPVDCDFTDELEYLSVKKIKVILIYRDQAFKLVELRGLVTDIYTSNKEEFIVVSNGDSIRLDRIFQMIIISN